MLLTYFVIGAVMWATGFLEWQETGMMAYFLDSPAGVAVQGAESVTSTLTSMGGPISNIVNTLGGGLMAVWQVIEGIISFTFWPVVALNYINAPMEIVVILGGSISVAFIGALITVIRGSA